MRMPPQAVIDLIQKDLGRVDRLILGNLDTSTALVRFVIGLVLNSDDFRIRPVLALVSARALGYLGESHYMLAAAIELIHASLRLHERVRECYQESSEVIDDDRLLGNPGKILLGDLLYTAAFKLVVSLNNKRIMEVLSNATTRIAEAEVFYHSQGEHVSLALDQRLNIVKNRDAKLFEAATQCAAILCGASSVTEEALTTYGMCLGTGLHLIVQIREKPGAILGLEYLRQIAHAELLHAAAAITVLPESDNKQALSHLVAWASQGSVANLNSVTQWNSSSSMVSSVEPEST